MTLSLSDPDEQPVESQSSSGHSVAQLSSGLFYGWVMLPIAMAGLIATSPGQTFGISIFIESFRKSLNLSHSQLSAAYMLGTLLSALPMTSIGALMDRYGLRRSMVIAVFLFGLACVLTSQVSDWLTLLVAFFLLRLLGPGALGFLSGNTLAFWFQRRLGLVEGIRQQGMACAMAIVPALNLWLLQSFGWRTAYLILGVSIWTIMLPLTMLLFRNRPEDVGQSLDGLPLGEESAFGDCTWDPSWDFTPGEAFRTRSFWIATAGTAAFGLIHTAVFFSIVPILQDCGLAEADAAGMLTTFALSMAFMQLVGGVLADRLPANILMAIALGGLAAAMWLLRMVSAPATAHFSGLVMGLSQGLFFSTSSPLWARYFGRSHLGKIRGTLVTINMASASIGPLLVGFARDTFGSYQLILAVFALLPVPLALLSFLATRPVKAVAQ